MDSSGRKDFVHQRHKWSEAADALAEETANLWNAMRASQPDAPLIALVGDSIVRGFGPRGFDFDPPSSNSFLQHPDRILDHFLRTAGKKAIAAFSGIAGTSQITKLCQNHLRPGDHIIFQDWGWRPRTKDAVFHQFASVASLVREFDGINLWLTNGYAAEGVAASFDPRVPCVDTTLSPNDIINEVALLCGVGIINVEQRFSFAQAHLKNHHLSLMLPDKIHPNAAGNVLLAGELYCCLYKETPPLKQLKEEMTASMNSLGYPSVSTDIIISIIEKALADGLQ